MPLLSILIALVILGVAVYLIRLIPMDETVRQIAQVVVIAIIVIYLLKLLLGGGMPDLRLG